MGRQVGYKDLFNIGSLRIGAHLFETRTGKQTANGTDETELKYDAFWHHCGRIPLCQEI